MGNEHLRNYQETYHGKERKGLKKEIGQKQNNIDIHVCAREISAGL